VKRNLILHIVLPAKAARVALLAVFVTLVVLPVARAQQSEPSLSEPVPPATGFVEDQVIVVFESEAMLSIAGNDVFSGADPSVTQLLHEFNVVAAEWLIDPRDRSKESFPPEILNMALLTLGEGRSVPTAIDAFSALDVVSYAGPNHILQLADETVPTLTPNDPLYAYGSQWGLNGIFGINAPAVWNSSTGSSAVKIGVIDSGIDNSHPDLSAKYAGGYDYIRDDPFPDDELGHGTHVAGIAAASTNNGLGMAGVSWNSSVMSYKVCDQNGWCYEWPILQAVTDAVNEPNVRVLNLSLGGQFNCPTSFANVFDYAYSKGVTVIAAAGNERSSIPASPASCDHVIAVGAVQSDGELASFSNYGWWVDLVAPGRSILSTYPNNAYVYLSGTSMSSPHVAGVASLIYAALEPDFLAQPETVDMVHDILLTTARDLGDSGRDFYYAYGLVDAAVAVERAKQLRYEPNDSASTARTIVINQPQVHSIYPISDEDWMTFTLSKDSAITLATSGNSGDTEMWLYNEDLQQLDYDNDTGQGDFSFIDRVCGIDSLPEGQYYVKVAERNNNAQITDYEIYLAQTESCSNTSPTLSNFTPVSGPVGTTVTVNGTNLNGVTGVTFNGTAAMFIPVSTTQLETTVPQGATTGKVTVTTAGGSVTSVEDFVVAMSGTWTPLNIGTATGSTTESGGQVTLTGLGGDIWGTSDSLHYAYQSANEDRTFIAKLIAWDTGGQSSAKAGLMIRASTAPSAPEFTIHVTGDDRELKVKYRTSTGWSTTNVNNPGSPSLPVWLRLVKSGNTVVASYSTNGTSWTPIGTAQALDGIESSYLYGMAVVSNSASAQASATFEVSSSDLPSISSFTPASGTVGTTVTINGTNLVGVTQVRFGGKTATFMSVSDTRLKATVPQGANTGKIAVTTAGGTATSKSNFIVTVPGAWTPLNIGTAAGATTENEDQITLTCLGGDIWSTADSLHYAYQPANGDRTFIAKLTTWETGGQASAKAGLMIRASTDPSAPEFTIHMTGDDRGLKVKYRTSAGWSTANSNGPVISSLPVWLKLVKSGNTVLASYSADGTSWTSIGTAQKIDGIESSYLYGMAVVSNSISNQASATFEVPDLNRPSITQFNPTSGSVGTTVTIDGTNFVGVTAVKFGGKSATFIPVSDTQLLATVPQEAATGKVAVTTAGGTATSATDYVVTKSTPSISDFDPGAGPIGTIVTITGTDLTGATAVTFNGWMAMFMPVSGNQIQATVPQEATTGKIAVTTPGGTATSAADYVVTTPPPSISDFDPASGPTGTIVTINGTDFTGAMAVTFNGLMAMFMPVSANEILATVPQGATTGKIAVTTAGGAATSAADFTLIGVEYHLIYLPAAIR
jgi:regulation of enolase protein 1 (concanavalin A-like superfamily)